MNYKDYFIEKEHDHYKVTAPDGREWTEDTIEDAQRTIDEES